MLLLKLLPVLLLPVLLPLVLLLLLLRTGVILLPLLLLTPRLPLLLLTPRLLLRRRRRNWGGPERLLHRNPAEVRAPMVEWIAVAHIASSARGGVVVFMDVMKLAVQIACPTIPR